MELSTAMKINPNNLKNHLVRELMLLLRLKLNGDAMVRMALSGKEVFPVFKYVVINHIYVDVTCDSENIKYERDRATHTKPNTLTFASKGSRHLVVRFIQNVSVHGYNVVRLPFEKITKLSLYECALPPGATFAAMIDSWADVEVLVPDPDVDFFQEVAGGTIMLPSLREMHIFCDNVEQFSYLMDMDPPFPLPEDVTFEIDAEAPFDFDIGDVAPYNPVNLALAHTFPHVKRLEINVHFLGHLNFELVYRLPVIILCCTGVENVKFMFISYRKPSYAIDIEKLYEWVGSSNFSVPVEIVYEDYVKYSPNDDLDSIYGHFKSIGFKENGNDNFSVEKVHHNAKLIHRIQRETNPIDSDDSMGFGEYEEMDVDDDDFSDDDSDVFEDVVIDDNDNSGEDL